MIIAVQLRKNQDEMRRLNVRNQIKHIFPKLGFFFTLLLFSLYFFLFKDKLYTWGLQRQSNIQKLIQFMQEGFDGIKIIKLLGRE